MNAHSDAFMDVHHPAPGSKSALVSLNGKLNDAIFREGIENVDVAATQAYFGGAAGKANVRDRLDDLDRGNQGIARRRAPVREAGARVGIATLEVVAQKLGSSFRSSQAKGIRP